MPKFEKLDPAGVHIGRGRAAAEQRAVYREAIRGAEAGTITLDRGDRANSVKRILTEAAKEEDMRIRSGWDDSKRVLSWKLVGA